VPVLNSEQVDVLRTDVEALADPAHPKYPLWHEFHANEAPKESGMVLFHALGGWRISPGLHDLLFHPRLLVPAMQLLGRERVRLWHDQLFCKPPRTGGVVAWHQDMSYWTRTGPVNHLTIHIALDSQTVESGALHYIPGSHRWPLLPVTSRHFAEMDSIRGILDSEQLAQFDRCVEESALGQPSAVQCTWCAG
jgi:hypothetical protein